MVLSLREPARLIDSDATDEFTLRLLESAAGDQPTTRAVSRAAVRVTERLADDEDLVAAARAREVATSGTMRRVKPQTLRITRAAGIGFVLGTSLAAAVVGVGRSPAPAAIPTAAHTGNVSHAPPTTFVSRAAAAEPEAAVEAAAASVPQPRDAKPAKQSNNDLGQELALLDAAKAALSAANPRGALSALDDAAQLPRRVLVPEATVLRVRALVALRRTSEARQLVETFVKQAPNSPVGPVLRDLVAPL